MLDLREPLETLIHSHLDRLGLTEEDLLAYALVLGRGEDAAS